MYEFPKNMKINKRHYLVLGLVSMGFLACNSDNGQQSMVDYSSGSAAAAIVGNSGNGSNGNSQASSLVSHPSTKLGNLMNQSGINSGGNLSVAGSGLNPAHGLPGHNCAIDVGAPLSSAGTVPQAVSKPAIGSTANARINPAHGQPDHDCSVAVGDPLPS
jgi:hypothetical protein